MTTRGALFRLPAWALLAASPFLFLSCGHGGAGQAGGPPPMPVEFVTLERLPIERSTEYIATLKSRRSTTIQPMVQGFITRIAVRSGDRVRAEDVLRQAKLELLAALGLFGN